MKQRQSLGSNLKYPPVNLKFGTSGRRGRVIDLTQLEVYANALADLEYLQSLATSAGGISRGDPFFLAYDLRPSSISFVKEFNGRGEIAQAIITAICDAGMRAVNLGPIPTPALANYSLSLGKGSMMVTGSHIPFDLNGYKTYSSRGELLKEQEAPILEQVGKVRERLYAQPAADSAFDELGFLRSGHQALPTEHPEARTAYIERYTHFFKGRSLAGQRIMVYQHSAVGRDLVAEILERFGAEVIKAGRSNVFVPIDTENMDAPALSVIQDLVDKTVAIHGPLHAVVSTDGDSDRPLILAMDGPSSRVRFLGGDLVGMVVAEFLGADAVVVPISCNDAIDRGELATIVQPKTAIGSPYVIAGIEAALQKGKSRVVGWEPNGGFLTGSDLERDSATLKALPTRDSVLPIVAALFAAAESGLSLVDRFDRLPKRFSRAGLLRQFPRPVASKILARLSPPGLPPGQTELADTRNLLAKFFTLRRGFGTITDLDYTDGIRMSFANHDVAHIRPSGNADELRIYAVANTQIRADAIVAMGVAEPNGILREMEQFLGQ